MAGVSRWSERLHLSKGARTACGVMATRCVVTKRVGLVNCGACKKTMFMAAVQAAVSSNHTVW